MIEYPALQPYAAQYWNLRGEPLRVTVRFKQGAHLAGYDPLNLDNLLARAVVEEATNTTGLPDTIDAYVLPVPLRCLWRSHAGLPLWAATAFRPVGMAVSDIAYWHKRAQSGRWSKGRSGKLTIITTKGRWMDRRVPLPTTLCETWVADCIGDAEEILRLLKRFAFIGKRRSNGFGEVKEWSIEPGSFELVENGILTRSMPLEAAVPILGQVPSISPAPVGWTPPQWKPSLFLPGWWMGTALE